MRTIRPGVGIALVERSGVIESRHTGHVIVLAPDGSSRLTLGDSDQPVFTRSCMKPMQTLAMLRLGFDGDPTETALACASHSGSAHQMRLIEASLIEAGLRAEDLQCPPDLPIGPVELRDHLAAGGGQSRLAMNCSGKHAAMLRTWLINHWSLADYLAPAHPLQAAIAATVSELTGDAIADVGVDGCGAPVLAITLAGLARAFAGLAAHPSDEHRRAVRSAMRAHPDLVGGPGRLNTELMRRVPGLIAKDGAEGCFAAALADGGAVAVKVDDGASRAAEVAAVAGLRHLGVDLGAPDALGAIPVLGRGRPVGSVRAEF